MKLHGANGWWEADGGGVNGAERVKEDAMPLQNVEGAEREKPEMELGNRTGSSRKGKWMQFGAVEAEGAEAKGGSGKGKQMGSKKREVGGRKGG